MKAKYKVGDKVRIVKKWSGDGLENSEGKMDKWLGETMTIRNINHGYETYKMEEDRNEGYLGGWNWFDSMIEGLAEENKKVVIVSNNNEVKATLYNDKKFVKEAKAVCSPSDEFNFRKGAELALERLLKEKPKKCPFCGGEAEVSKEFYFSLMGSNGYFVKCKNCSTRTVAKQSEVEAIDVWNKREE